MLSKLEYKNNILFFDNVNLEEISKKYKTPIYIYSRDRIVENYYSYKDAFEKFNINNYQISYAIKANENLTILKILKDLGSGIDTVSMYEIEKALYAGFDPEKIVFSGVGKGRDELEFAINNNIGQINIESYEEFLNISNIVQNNNKIANISVRINPNIDAHTHSKITTGKKENKFGVEFEVAEKIFSEAKNNELLNFKGISVHIGSQILDIEAFRLMFEYLKKIYDKYDSFTTIDFGGGLGIQYREHESTPSKEQYIELMSKYFKEYKGKIIVEPGRSIIGDAGIFLSKIVYIKKTQINNFVIVDAGMNNLIRPAMYDAYHHPMLVKIHSENKKIYNIVGPICESGDTFVNNIELNEIDDTEDNYIVFLSAGAYGRSMSSNYNLHDIAGELLIEDGNVKEIRKNINYKDLLKFEEI